MEANRRRPHCAARQGSQSDRSLARLQGSAVFTGSQQVASEGVWGIGEFVPSSACKAVPSQSRLMRMGPLFEIKPLRGF